jgi:hypothetical protein
VDSEGSLTFDKDEVAVVVACCRCTAVLQCCLLSSPECSDRFLFSGYQYSFLGVKRLGRGDNSFPPCAEVKNERSYKSIFPYSPLWYG